MNHILFICLFLCVCWFIRSMLVSCFFCLIVCCSFSGDGSFFFLPAIQCHLARLYRLTAESSKLVVVLLPLHYNNYYVGKNKRVSF